MFQGKEYIYKVFKEQSFSRAAKEMYISQPSLSASVRRVEEKVGAPLFDRSTKPLSLTECGEKYIEAVEKMMAAEEEFREYISDWEGLKTGTLTVGGSRSSGCPFANSRLVSTKSYLRKPHFRGFCSS